MPTAHSLPAVVDVHTVAALLKQNAPLHIIDVRKPAACETVHIPGSYTVPLDALPAHRAALREAPCAPAVLVCWSGARARQAEGVLRAADLHRVHVLEGGITAWEAAGQAVRRGQERWTLERQAWGAAGSLVLLGVLGGVRAWKPLTYLAAAVGAGLTYSAVSDSCAMGMLLSRLPYNQGARGNVRAALIQLAAVE
ncbi:MAG: rhodanese-like domain-containing protein [Chloroflexota bacterium]